ncbi:MAG: bifunctional phosphoglucose/phosphomannose isomerase [Patescibacteria group bacterium]|nr:bifunctional phosphoglucose/phosphomannose isomerase [bacterium]MDZ4240703.1 bifunctional phosphoglucose/phosphomannose isomerase [Patescibacteria group bacterium]
MEESIIGFPEQFSFHPVIENADALRPAEHFILCGMGGSHLAAGLIKLYDPTLNLSVHYDYALPQYPHAKLKEGLLIASSFSGNTVETIDFAQKAFDQKLNLIIIASGGKLLEFAKINNIPYIALPAVRIQPRNAVGYSLLALAEATSNKMLLNTLWGMRGNLDAMRFKQDGEMLAEKLQGKVPVIYSSNNNHSLAYNWKIKFNETAKIPAFFNMFPELNHNELAGFDTTEEKKALMRPFHFIFLRDSNDHPAIIKRMDIAKDLYLTRGFDVEEVMLTGSHVLEKAFNSIFLADWTAFSLASFYGVDPEQVPLIEEFKSLIA